MKELAEAMEKMEEIKQLKQKILDCFKSEINTKGFECMSYEEAGEVVDMIKDLAETEKSCMEALYYQKVTEAMVSYDEPRYGESMKMGYNPNRYKSSGRFAGTGKGSRIGYMMPHVPYLEYDGEMYPEDYMREARMGYDNNKMMDPRSTDNDMDQRYGRAYNDYKTMRRHYTETKSPEDKKEMDSHAEEHVRDTIATIRDIWGDADPSLKRRMREDFTKLLGEMGPA